MGHADLNVHWVGAGHLEIGDKIRTAAGSSGIVLAVVNVVQAREMLNLEVQGNHDFFVGDGKWLVHNTNGCPQFDELAQMRQDLGLPAAGSIKDKSTLAKLEIGGKEYFGLNAHGRPITVRVNNITKTHAEADVMQQAINDGVHAKTGTLYVDRDLCAACGRNGGVRSFVEAMGLDELTVISPSGTTIIRPR